MSSLRRRAIVVSRARSPERSSIGGRVSARAAAAESSGSASTRSQAIASRTSGRWKSAAGPERWKGMPRSSIAAATAPPCAGRVGDEHADPLRRRRRRRSGARPRAPTACAWARSLRAAPEAELRARGSAARGRPRRRRDGGRGTRRSSADRRPPSSSAKSWFGLSRGERLEQRPLGRRRLLELVDHQVLEALGDLAADVGRARRSRQSRARKTSPRSRLPASARIRSWAV